MDKLRHPTPVPDSIPSKVVSVDHSGLCLSVRCWGDEGKPPVILQHGGKDHGRSWDWLVAALADRYHLIVPDLRGHGESDHVPGGGYDLVDMVADFAAIDAVLQHSHGTDERLILVGHSLGGFVLTRFAAAMPERVKCLVNIEGLGFSPAHYEKVIEEPPATRWRTYLNKRSLVQSRERRAFAAQGDAVARLAALHQQLSLEDAEHLARHAIRQTPKGWVWKYDPMIMFTPLSPTPPAENNRLFEDVSCPTLLCYGGKSWAVPPTTDKRLDYFPNASCRLYPDAGHWVQHDARQDFTDDLNTFLEVNG